MNIDVLIADAQKQLPFLPRPSRLKRCGFFMHDTENRAIYRLYLDRGRPLQKKQYLNILQSASGSFLLYLHLPFCINKCKFCCFFSVQNPSRELIEKYLESLKKEIDILAGFLALGQLRISSIYFGGGTPTLLTTGQLEALFRHLFDKLPVSTGTPCTVESSPETLYSAHGKDTLKCLIDNGVTRLSIGIQTFKNDLLSRIGRIHNAAMAIAAYNNARNAGFDNINLDLIYGLPTQTASLWGADLMTISELKPESYCLYHLNMDAPKIHRSFCREKTVFPSQNQLLEFKIMALSHAEHSEYRQKMIPELFALPTCPDDLPVFNEEKIGIGASAGSYVNAAYHYNYRSMKRYMESVDKGILPIAYAMRHSPQNMVEREVIFQLRQGTLVKKDIEVRHNIVFDRYFQNPLEELQRLEMVSDHLGSVELTNAGKLYAEEVFKFLIRLGWSDRCLKKLMNTKSAKALSLKYRESHYKVLLSQAYKLIRG